MIILEEVLADLIETINREGIVAVKAQEGDQTLEGKAILQL